VPVIGIALFDGVEELDWVGPWEVLRTWEHYWPDDGVSVFTAAHADGAVTCAKGMRAIPDHRWDRAPAVDVLIYPGGRGTRPQLGDILVRAWLHDTARSASIMASVCTGSLVFADAGLLDGRSATTHWQSLELLATLGRDIDVRPDERFVDDGNLITASGVSAGIDMALHLVGRLQSPERSRQVRRAIQYDPAPPY
jgi:transcriptional regulator GlxA family with amidase domain